MESRSLPSVKIVGSSAHRRVSAPIGSRLRGMSLHRLIRSPSSDGVSPWPADTASAEHGVDRLSGALGTVLDEGLCPQVEARVGMPQVFAQRLDSTGSTSTDPPVKNGCHALRHFYASISLHERESILLYSRERKARPRPHVCRSRRWRWRCRCRSPARGGEGSGCCRTNGVCSVQLATWVLERAIRAARVKVPGRPPNFRYDDLRHASAKIALDTCGHLWPDSEDSTRAAVGAVLEAHAQNTAEILADCSTDC